MTSRPARVVTAALATESPEAQPAGPFFLLVQSGSEITRYVSWAIPTPSSVVTAVPPACPRPDSENEPSMWLTVWNETSAPAGRSEGHRRQHT